MTLASSVDRAARLLRAACISTSESGPGACRALAGIPRVAAVTILAGVILVGGTLASAWVAAGAVTPGVAAGDHSVASRPAGKAAIANPSWKELSVPQQAALSPLANEWDKLDALHKSKWLEISRRYVSMKPDDQSRMQERMRAWVALTPEQRRVARESYARTKKLNTDQKSAQWQQYQQLPEDQKKTLAAEAAKNKVAALPSVHSKAKTVAPIKSTAKPILQQSVQPHLSTAQAGASAAERAASSPSPSVLPAQPSATHAAPAPAAPAMPAVIAPAPAAVAPALPPSAGTPLGER